LPAVELIVVGAVGGVFTVIVKVAQAVVVALQGLVPTLLTKYVVVVLGVTARVAVVPTNVPPQLPVNH
jgi:hypothetical protein